MDGFVLTVQRMIQASPEDVFDVLADPSRHSIIDGTGLLQGTKEGALSGSVWGRPSE